MLKEQWLSAEQLRTLQNRRLQSIVSHVYDKVPYYRRLLDREGIKPDTVLAVGDLQKIPITTKADLRNLSVEEITSRDADLRQCYRKNTSGSTGIPMTVFWDNYFLMVFYSTCVRTHRALRSGFTDKFMCIGPNFYPENLLIQRLGLCRVKTFSPFLGPQEHLRLINSYRPDVLFCYPSVISSLTRFVNNGWHEKVHSPRLVVTSSELLDNQTRASAAELFGSVPAQFYGSCEVGRIGSECSHRDGIHIHEDLFVPEFLPAGEMNGQQYYRLVLTCLYNYTMPFLRYDQGDLVSIIPEACKCGRSFVRIQMLTARLIDTLSLPDGTIISALHLTGIIQDMPGINQFKIIQKSPEQLVIQIIKGDGYSESAADDVLKQIRSLLPGVRPLIEIVNVIERDPSGKCRPFQSMAGTGQ